MPSDAAASERWGVYDTQDHLWIGNSKGPLAYSDQVTAQMVAQITEDRITGTDLGGRFRAKPLPGGQLREKDSIVPRFSAVESMERIEGGRDAQ